MTTSTIPSHPMRSITTDLLAGVMVGVVLVPTAIDLRCHSGFGASGWPLRSYRTRPSRGHHRKYARPYLRPEHLCYDCPRVGGIRAWAGGWLYSCAPIWLFSDSLRLDPIGTVHRLHPPLAAVGVLHRRGHSSGSHPGSPSHRSAPSAGWCRWQRQSLD